MPRIRVTSLGKWEHPEQDWLEYGQFKVTYLEALKSIEYEIGRLGVDLAVLEIDLPKGSIGRGRLPKLGREPESSRVRLSFEHPELGPLQYPCYTYRRCDHNVRAIGLTLEAQRAIDRFGAAQGGQQYRGWMGLPLGETSGDQEVWLPGNLEEATSFLADVSGNSGEEDTLVASRGFFTHCYKEAAKKLHPDQGGSERRFKALQAAKSLLDEFYEQLEREAS